MTTTGDTMGHGPDDGIEPGFASHRGADEGAPIDANQISRWTTSREEGIHQLEMGHAAEATVLLASAATQDPSGESASLLGLAHFRLEQYDRAAEHYADALAIDATNVDWREMHDRSVANARAEVHVFVPEIRHLDRDALLAPPPVPSLPEPFPDRPTLLFSRLRVDVGKAIGDVFGKGFKVATRIAGMRTHGSVWTNWSDKGVNAGVLTLAHMRETLMKHNLRSTYPPGALVGFADPTLTPPPGVTHFRTADGTWNRLDDPKEGAAGTRFLRNVANSSIHPADDDELMTPNPRLVSRKLLSRKVADGEPVVQEVPFLNLLAASWIQFQNHDWVTHGENLMDEFIEVPLAEDDPARRRFHQDRITIGRTQPDPTRLPEGETTPVTFINEVTHWWDGSQIYGSDQATQDRLRGHVLGKLRLADDGRLPLMNGVEDSGMVRNWWVGTAMLHTLFAREHNAICDRLHESYPTWNDDRLFNVARLVNAAVMAKIHSIEWTPAILPNPSLARGLNANWYGLLTYMFRKGADRKTVATFNVESPELGGLVGNHIERHGQPYGLAEEFVEVYRLHSLLPEHLHLRNHATGSAIEEMPVPATRQAGSAKTTGEIGLVDLFYSFGNQHPGQLVLNNYPAFMQELSVPGNPLFDMATVDIVRARERGVPRYNEFRRQLGLQPIRSFDDLTPDKDAVAAIREVYGDNVELLDLMVGTLAEAHRPTYFGFGETMFQIFIINASRRLQADRFFTDDYREEVYTKEGMDWVDATTFKQVLLRHFPELATTGLANVTNAFEPWDTDEVLSRERHPLRACDPELKHDPWTGDSYR